MHTRQVDNHTTRKVGPNDVSRRSGPGMFSLSFFITNVYLYIIANYNDTTARHNGEEGFRQGKYARTTRDVVRAQVRFTFYLFSLY
jgi:hypothetical protein